MYETVFKACFRDLTSFEDLDGFSGENKEFCGWLITVKVWENCEGVENKKELN